MYNANVTFEDAQIVDIHAEDLEDILVIESCPSVTFDNFSSSGCQARNQILDIVDSTVKIFGSSFRNAHAMGLSINNSSTAIFDTVFENLTGPSEDPEGGALFADNYDGGNYLHIHIQASNFSNNIADGIGGAMFLRCANCTFEDVRFANNTSGVNRGAILLEKSRVDVAFNNCFVANNTAGFNGAAYAYPGVHGVSWTNCTFTGNLAYQGGALSFWQVPNVLVDSCRFEQNNVRPEPNKSSNPGAGAALFVDGYEEQSTTLYILNSTFF